MHTKKTRNRLNKAFVETMHSIELDYCWEQAQRLGSQLNRNAMICDLHQTGIYKKVLRKGSFKLIFR